jgi:UDP-3-O-[3-hydroxymyristoyl] glucosamine N-acyltransferase
VSGLSFTSFTLGELADHIQARLIGDADIVIDGLGSLATAQAGEISHLSSPGFREYLADSKASAVILQDADLENWGGNALVVSDPYLAFARISQLFERTPGLAVGVDTAAHVHPSAVVHPGAAVAAGVVIAAGARVDAGVRLYSNCVVGERCHIQHDVSLMPNAVLYADVSLGPRSIVHSGAVIGADGFGFAPDENGHLQAIAQLGGVRIGADVSVGAGSTIDRGAIDDTVIEDGVKIDNQVQIGHNCHIGAHSIICGCVGIAGSVTIGKHCVLAGGVGVGGAGQLELVDGVVLTAATTVLSSITEPGIYSGGVLHNSTEQWKRNALRFHGLDSLNRRVRALEKRLREGSSDRQEDEGADHETSTS